MIVFEGIETDFVHVKSSLMSLVSFLCTNEILVCIDYWVTFI